MARTRVSGSSLSRSLFGVTFQNPVLLAAGTCGFGMELADVVDLEALGGFVTKSVTLEPRLGNPAPRVAEFTDGMINSVGLANPGLEGAKKHKLPWIRDNVKRPKVFVSVAGHTTDEYEHIVGELDGEDGFVGFELNLSCPNDKQLKSLPFALDPEALTATVERCRARTQRPLIVKLAPNDPDLDRTVRAAEAAGADGLTLVNTLPGLVMHGDKPALGAGAGGMSGPGIRPAGVRSVSVAHKSTELPLVGVGGIGSAKNALEYLHAGASLIQVGTATFADPRTGERIAADLAELARRGRVPLPVSSSRTEGILSASAANPTFQRNQAVTHR